MKVSSRKGAVRFGRCGKLSLRYIGPYEITERIGLLAYRLDLPTKLSQIHNNFHVSILRRYKSDPIHVIVELDVKDGQSRFDYSGAVSRDGKTY